jgi:hypothetical protein
VRVQAGEQVFLASKSPRPMEESVGGDRAAWQGPMWQLLMPLGTAMHPRGGELDGVRNPLCCRPAG